MVVINEGFCMYMPDSAIVCIGLRQVSQLLKNVKKNQGGSKSGDNIF